jgi:hypothetical protein
MVGSLGLSRFNLMLLAGIWGWVMVRAGLWVVIELPGVVGVSSRWSRIGGATLVAAGIFIFAYFTRRCFPQANSRVKLICEVAPWIGLVGFVIGG